MSKLSVITKLKKLMEYILTITKNSDVKYRFMFVNNIHNLCMGIIGNLYSANNPDKISIRYRQEDNAKYTDMFEYYTMDEINEYEELGLELKVLNNVNEKSIKTI